MEIGVPKETGRDEYRVGLVPSGVRRLVGEGHRLYVEQGAGESCRFEDHEYREAGAEIVYGREEALRRGRLLLTVRGLPLTDLSVLEPGQVLAGFLHLAVAPKEVVRTLLDRQVTAVGYEIIAEPDGRTPILSAIGLLAGNMVVHIAAHLLGKQSGGRGVLLGSMPDIPATRALVLGAGTVGRTAAKLLAAAGVHVTLADRDRHKLRQACGELPGEVEAHVADAETLRRSTAEAEVVIGAVRIPGERAPYLVTREMVSKMKAGSVIIDVAIDQGGCVETSRPTTLANPTFVVSDVIHYCVPNLTANIPRTASKVLSQAHLPYTAGIAAADTGPRWQPPDAVRKGTYLRGGKILFGELAERPGHSPEAAEKAEGRSGKGEKR